MSRKINSKQIGKFLIARGKSVTAYGEMLEQEYEPELVQQELEKTSRVLNRIDLQFFSQNQEAENPDLNMMNTPQESAAPTQLTRNISNYAVADHESSNIGTFSDQLSIEQNEAAQGSRPQSKRQNLRVQLNPFNAPTRILQTDYKADIRQTRNESTSEEENKEDVSKQQASTKKRKSTQITPNKDEGSPGPRKKAAKVTPNRNTPRRVTRSGESKIKDSSSNDQISSNEKTRRKSIKKTRTLKKRAQSAKKWGPSKRSINKLAEDESGEKGGEDEEANEKNNNKGEAEQEEEKI